jgi:two-component sensor histidine kinase
LLQNALEHAFVGRPRGTVRITLGQARQDVVVTVADDGVGLPAEQPTSLGLEIVETLVRDDLHGRLTFNNTGAGTQVIVRVPHSTDVE